MLHRSISCYYPRMDYTDVYFTLDALALAALLAAMGIVCYFTHRHYRRRNGSANGSAKRRLRRGS